MVRIVAGNSITSANVDANKKYVDGRDLNTLKEVGAVTTAQADVLARADGIIDSQPTNGAADIDELVRLENPNYAATLFPEERAVQPGLWKTLEWADVPAAVALPDLPPLAETDLTSSPSALDYNRQFPIADLPGDLQKTAKRIQLVQNSDSTATTINLVDLQKAMEPGSSGRFLTTEIDQMKKAVEFIRNKVRETAPAMSARVQVSKPGTESREIPFAGDVKFTMATTTKLVETADVTGTYSRANHQLRLERTATINVAPPAGKSVVLINLENGQETVVKAAKQFPAGQLAGKYRVEVWAQGQREHSGEVAVPPQSQQHQVLGLNQRMGFSFVDPDGNALKRTKVNLPSDPRLVGSRVQQERFEYVPTGAPPAATPSPYAQIKPGVYQLQSTRHGPLTFEAFPENLIRLTHNGGQMWLRPEPGSGEQGYRGEHGGLTARFYGGRHLAFFQNNSHNDSVNVTDDARIG